MAARLHLTGKNVIAETWTAIPRAVCYPLRTGRAESAPKQEHKPKCSEFSAGTDMMTRPPRTDTRDRARRMQVKRLGNLPPRVIATLIACIHASPSGGDDLEPSQMSFSSRPAFVNTAEPATPGAREIVLDLPSALYWPRHQRGEIGQWTYAIFPDGSAKILSQGEKRRLAAQLDCEAAVGCDVRFEDGRVLTVDVGAGERPAMPSDLNLDAAARYLAAWILAGTAPPPPPPPPEPDLEAVVDETVLETTAKAPPIPEGPADLPEGVQPVDPAGGADTGDLVAPASTAAPSGGPLPEVAPVCAEQEPFVPFACAEPTGPLQPAEDVPRAQPASPLSASAPQSQAPGANRAASPAPPPTPAALTKPKDFIERFNINCSLTGSTSLAHLNPDEDSRGNAKPRVSLGCSARLTDKLSFRGALLAYTNPKDQKPWDPDYTYAFTYRVTEKLSLGYSNYSARFTSGGSPVADLFRGKLRASYKLPALTLPNDKKIPCTASLGLPQPLKESLNLSCGYAVTDKLRVSGTAYFYKPGEQGTYQPDYSYTASYRFNDDWILSYNNYSNNRWPWNKGDAPGPGITGGSLSLTYKFKF
ncbi:MULTISPECIES: hypothetical protein [unclassified Mameliella]|uniref:hypothetical protein n=2 Tax=Mameliella TaxID=1434019 RepID=UPI00273E83AB|nr:MULTISPECIES: hypothetical protein [unclassified Mameliella]